MLNEIIFHSIYRLKQKRNLNLLTKFTFIKKNKVISNFKSIEEEENKEKINLYLKQQEILKNVFSKKEQNENQEILKKMITNKEKFIEKDKSLFIEQYIFPRGLKLVSVFNCVMVLSQGINIIPLHQIFWMGSLLGLSKLYFQFAIDSNEEESLKLFLKLSYLVIFSSLLLSIGYRFSIKKFFAFGIVMNYIGMIILVRSSRFFFFIPQFICNFYTINFFFAMILALIFTIIELNNDKGSRTGIHNLFGNEIQVKNLMQVFSNDLINIIAEIEKENPNFQLMRDNINKINKIPLSQRIKDIYENYKENSDEN